MTSPQEEFLQIESKEAQFMRKEIIKEIKKIEKKKYKSLQSVDLEPLIREYEQMKFLPKDKKEVKQWVTDFIESKKEILELLVRREKVINDLYYSHYPTIHPDITVILWEHYKNLPGAEPFTLGTDVEDWAAGFMTFFAELLPEVAIITEEFGDNSDIELNRRIVDGSIILPTDTSVLKIEE